MARVCELVFYVTIFSFLLRFTDSLNSLLLISFIIRFDNRILF